MNTLTLSFLFLLTSVTGFAQVPKIDCVEDKQILLNQLVPLQLNGAKTTIGIDETLPVKALIEHYIVNNPDMVITEVKVISSSSKVPANKKKASDPSSEKENSNIAVQRAAFVTKSLKEIQASRTSLLKVPFVTKAFVVGPKYVPNDLNDRWKDKNMTPGYKEMVDALYEQIKSSYKDKGEDFILLPEEILSYPTLFEAKFKPFQGFRVLIYGYNKKESKCSEVIPQRPGTRPVKAKGQ